MLAQLAAFKELFGRAPDFVDGHQHAQLFPQVRDAFLRAVKLPPAPGSARADASTAGRAARRAEGAGARRAQRAIPQARRPCRHPVQSRLAGAYDFSQAPDFGVLMGEFLEGLPEGGLVMCHPGFVDETLRSLDPLTTQREAERVSGKRSIPALLAANKVTLS